MGSFAFVYYTETQIEEQKRGRPWNEASMNPHLPVEKQIEDAGFVVHLEGRDMFTSGYSI